MMYKVIGKQLQLLLFIAVTMVCSAVVHADARVDQARTTGIWEVEPGDSLYRIAKRMFPDSRADRARLRARLHSLNPEAFRNNDPNILRADAKLRLPEFAVNTVAKAEPEAPATADTETIDSTETAADTGNTQTASTTVQSVVEPQPEETKPELNLAGRVLFARGGMTARQSSGAVRSLSRNSDVFQGDTITTPKRGFGQVQLADGALLAIRPSTELVIEEFRYTGVEDGSESSVLRLIRGGFRTITGAIGKVNKRTYRVNTLVATVGIRGTHYGLRFCEPACTLSDGTSSEGLFGGVAEGTIAVGNNSGEAGFGGSEYFRVDDIDSPPVALPGAPGIIFDGGETASASGDDGADNGLLADPSMYDSIYTEPTVIGQSSDEVLNQLIRTEPNLGVEPTAPTSIMDPPVDPPTDPPPTDPPPTEPVEPSPQ